MKTIDLWIKIHAKLSYEKHSFNPICNHKPKKLIKGKAYLFTDGYIIDLLK